MEKTYSMTFRDVFLAVISIKYPFVVRIAGYKLMGMVAGILILVLLLELAIPSHQTEWTTVYTVLVIGLIVVYLLNIGLSYLRYKEAYQASKKLVVTDKDFTISLGQEGFVSTVPFGQVTEAYVSFGELIISTKVGDVVIPTRIFSPEELQKLLKLLNHKG